MSYVDLIIKYLSGDLSREEVSSFEKELESNEELKNAFEEQSAAFELIRDQLQKRDQRDFEAKLREVMSHETPVSATRRGGLRVWWFIPLAAACSLALFLVLLTNHPGNEQILARYNQAVKDPLVLAYYQDTRGETEPGIMQYFMGEYPHAMELLSKRITQESENKLIQLYYLLSAMELDRQQEALIRLSSIQSGPLDLVDQSIAWYSALALIKSDRREEALESLRPLTEQAGPYQNDAVKLEKVLLK